MIQSINRWPDRLASRNKVVPYSDLLGSFSSLSNRIVTASFSLFRQVCLALLRFYSWFFLVFNIHRDTRQMESKNGEIGLAPYRLITGDLKCNESKLLSPLENSISETRMTLISANYYLKTAELNSICQFHTSRTTARSGQIGLRFLAIEHFVLQMRLVCVKP